jgi:hypothetical protein
VEGAEREGEGEELGEGESLPVEEAGGGTAPAREARGEAEADAVGVWERLTEDDSEGVALLVGLKEGEGRRREGAGVPLAKVGEREGAWDRVPLAASGEVARGRVTEGESVTEPLLDRVPEPVLDSVPEPVLDG